MGKEANSEEVKMSFLYRLIALALSIWLAGWVAMLLLGQLDWRAYGQLGDAFGVVNALFSALAFAGLIFTALLQRKELHLQRKELALTRSELSGQKEQMEKQNETWIRQGFERSFFEMLSLHNQLVTSLVFHNQVGRNCFGRILSEIEKRYKGIADMNEWTTVEQNFHIVFSDLPPDFSNYFRILYNILKLVNQSRIDNKKDYTNLVRALLTQNELVVILYNCIGPFGKEKLKPLVEEFAILKHYNPEFLVNSDHIGFFEQSAFSGSAFISAEQWSAARRRCTLNGESLDD